MNETKIVGNIKLLFGMIFLLFIPFSSYPNESKITFNFDNVDIKTVINAVSKYTKINYLVSPEVKGKVTFISPKPMDKEELLSAFSSILEVHGYIAERKAGHTIIIPKVSECQKKLNKIRSLLES